MEILADTSVFIAVIANEPEKARLIQQTQGADLFAAASLAWEVGNAFVAMLKRRRITAEQAKQAITAFQSISVALVEVDL